MDKNKKAKNIIEGTAIAYYRYSSARQREESIEIQRDNCEALAKRYNAEIIKEYADKEENGKEDNLENRVQFLQLFKDVETNDNIPEFCFVFRTDRFSRDTSDGMRYIKKLHKHGIKVIACKGMQVEKGATLQNAVAFALGEAEDDAISDRARAAAVKYGKLGQYMGSAVPFGYEVDKSKRFQINPQTEEYARYIFTSFLDGLTLRQIADSLNEKGVLNGCGRKWRHQTIANILRNEFYTGTYHFEPSDMDEPIHIINNHPAIIDDVTFRRVQEKLSLRSRAPRAVKSKKTEKERYLLSGKIYCGECGSTMQGMAGRLKSDGTGDKYRYYACKRRREEKDCKKEHVPKDVLEDFVFQRCLEVIQSTDNIALTIYNVYAAKYTGSGSENEIDRDIRRLNNKIEYQFELSQKPENAESAVMRKMYANKIEELSNKIEELEKQRKEIHKQLMKIPSVFDIQSWLDEINTKATGKERQKVFDVLVRSVWVTDTRIIVEFNLNDNDPIDYDTFKKVMEDENITDKQFALGQTGGANFPLK